MSKKDDKPREDTGNFLRTPPYNPITAEGLTVTSGAIATAYTDLRSTFNVDQLRIAQKTYIEENILKLVEQAEEQTTLFRKQLADEEQKTKTERNRFYTATAIAVVALVVGVVGILISLL